MSYNLGHVVGADGKGIVSIEKTGTSGLVDTYTITYTDDTTSTFEVTNGRDGSGGNDIVTAWETVLSDEKIPSEKLTKNTIDTKLDKVHSSYKGKNVVTNSSTGAIEFENKPSIPSKISDLTNDSDFIETSSTSGLIKNDGSIDTSTYLTEMKIGSTSGLPVKTGSNGALTTGSFGTSSGTFAEGNHTHSGYVSGTKVTSWSSTTSDSNIPSEKLVKGSLDNKISTSSTTGLVKNDGSIDTSTYLTTGSASSTYVPKTDIVDNLTTSDATKVLSAKQGKALKDLIGDAITYINL